jgi:hypothetical protein
MTQDEIDTLAKDIIDDSKWWTRLYMRWTVVYWMMTIFAAGTAVTAAIKNVLPSHSSAGGISKTDITILALALLSTISTAMQAVMKPALMADAYRDGDLIMQGARFDYLASEKTQSDLDKLLAAWHKATDLLPRRMNSGK